MEGLAWPSNDTRRGIRSPEDIPVVLDPRPPVGVSPRAVRCPAHVSLKTMFPAGATFFFLHSCELVRATVRAFYFWHLVQNFSDHLSANPRAHRLPPPTKSVADAQTPVRLRAESPDLLVISTRLSLVAFSSLQQPPAAQPGRSHSSRAVGRRHQPVGGERAGGCCMAAR